MGSRKTATSTFVGSDISATNSYDLHSLSTRRRSTMPPIRATASEMSKSVELESRIGRLESLVKGLQEELAIRQRREIAMQAQLDHLWDRVKMDTGV
jgi:uncharacterized coiled-coil protein SlyX